MTSTANEVKIDPEFSALIPPQTVDEVQGLEVSLLTDGCQDALTAWGGLLLDGHLRYKLCKKNGIPFEVREATGIEDRDAAKRWIILHQFARRNLTTFQRAELAIKLKPIIAAKAKERMMAGKGDDDSGGRGKKVAEKPDEKRAENPMSKVDIGFTTRGELAKKAGVSPSTIEKAEFLDKHADEATKGKLRAGKMKLSKAVEEVKAKQAAASGKPAPKPTPKPRKIACECGHLWTPVCPKCKRPYSR